MRSALIALRAGGMAAALAAFTAVAAGPAASAPAALSADEENRGGVAVDPHRAEPGAQAKLRVHGCDARWATARSSVFVAEAHLSPGRDGDGTLRGDAMISSRAEPGRHAVRVRCDGSDLHGSVEVVRHGGQDHGKNPSDEREKDAAGDRGKDPSDEHGKGSAGDREKGSAGDRGKDSAGDRGKDSAGDRGKDPSDEHGKDSAGEHGKDPAKDAAKDHAKDPAKDHGQGDRDEGREHPDPHRTPVRPVHAGGGGMAAELAEAARIAERAKQAGGAAEAGSADGAAGDRTAPVAAKKDHGDDGPGLPHTVIGAVLAAAATLAVAGRALALRRRRSGE
ncbi:hypothetical protein [Streptomyces sp. NPDC007369]|uniref:hypothetical protein n=1 Tax=Streptomyces sp. NPDC007369 TaxID=3154589 RepID=UPI0033E8DE83